MTEARAKREELERVLDYLRANLRTWRVEDEKPTDVRGRLRAAFFAATNRRWEQRIETLCVRLEGEITRLRTAEQRAAGAPRSLLSTLLG